VSFFTAPGRALLYFFADKTIWSIITPSSRVTVTVHRFVELDEHRVLFGCDDVLAVEPGKGKEIRGRLL
jgi:hypothetical protein